MEKYTVITQINGKGATKFIVVAHRFRIEKDGSIFFYSIEHSGIPVGTHCFPAGTIVIKGEVKEM